MRIPTDAHARLRAAALGERYDDDAEPAKPSKREQEINEQRVRDAAPDNAHSLLREAFTGEAPSPAGDPHTRLARVLGARA